jgi:mannose-6-phosphate isomerase-like protein (cupin superfamily)
MSLGESQLIAFVDELAARRAAWEGLLRHEPGARMYAQIWDAPEANAWLICWSLDTDTGWHDHDDAAAAIAVVEGTVQEERLCLGGAPAARLAGRGSSLYVPSTAIHRVRHAGRAPAVTIHAYSPPLRRTGAYTVAIDGQLQREAQPYDRELRAVAAAG